MLLALALVWGALLVTWLRSRHQDGGFADPVGTFNRHLRVLERTAPSRYQAANRRRAPQRPGGIGPYRPAPPPARPTAGARRAGPPSAPAVRRAQSQKRRRDVFFALLAGVVGSLVLAIIPGLHAMMYVQVLFDLLMAGYVALLVRMRNLAAERDMKLSYFPTAARGRPARGGFYASGGEVAYGVPAGYGDHAYGDYGYGNYGYDDGYGGATARRAAN